MGIDLARRRRLVRFAVLLAFLTHAYPGFRAPARPRDRIAFNYLGTTTASGIGDRGLALFSFADTEGGGLLVDSSRTIIKRKGPGLGETGPCPLLWGTDAEEGGLSV